MSAIATREAARARTARANIQLELARHEAAGFNPTPADVARMEALADTVLSAALTAKQAGVLSEFETAMRQ